MNQYEMVLKKPELKTVTCSHFSSQCVLPNVLFSSFHFDNYIIVMRLSFSGKRTDPSKGRMESMLSSANVLDMHNSEIL
jgi:hypothetical protein